MTNNFVNGVLKGDPLSIARVITMIENNHEKAIPIIKTLHRHTGKAHIIGITGVMGSGKSSLIYELAKKYREKNKKIGIIAIDPTSPFSGGALLGDRIRMMNLADDENVFIRSMGTRGMLGGLTSAVYDTINILDAAGKDIIMVETVGVGQAEVDIVKIADTTLVVLVPGLGDSIQTIKAGIMEIGDIFVVNKADRPGVEQTIAELKTMLDLTRIVTERETPIITTIAPERKGIDELINEIEKHKKYLKKNNMFEEKRRKRYETELVEIIKRKLTSLIFDETNLKEKIQSLTDQILKKEIDPHTAAEEILTRVIK